MILLRLLGLALLSAPCAKSQGVDHPEQYGIGVLVCLLVVRHHFRALAVNTLGGTLSRPDLSHGNILPIVIRPWGFNGAVLLLIVDNRFSKLYSTVLQAGLPKPTPTRAAGSSTHLTAGSSV
jgi:hypothetical protein